MLTKPPDFGLQSACDPTPTTETKMTFRIVEVTSLEEPEQGLYGMIVSRTRVVRTGIETPAYALKLARLMEVSEENACDMSHFEVRDSNNSRWQERVSLKHSDEEIPF
jgi:hypothetical protein